MAEGNQGSRVGGHLESNGLSCSSLALHQPNEGAN